MNDNVKKTIELADSIGKESDIQLIDYNLKVAYLTIAFKNAGLNFDSSLMSMYAKSKFKDLFNESSLKFERSKQELSDEVFMYDEDESDARQLYFIDNLFYAVNTNNCRVFRFKKPFATIAKSHRDQILEYNLGLCYNDSDQVTLKDVFLHGKYIVEVNQ